MKRKSWYINEPITHAGTTDILLPKGSYVVPIHWDHLPYHIKQDYSWLQKDDRFTMCYTAKGMMPILTERLSEEGDFYG